MKHLFIINPAAGKKKNTQRLEEAIRALDVEWEIVHTAAAGDARRYAAEAAARGEPVRIYACGGDGTLNEVVNGAAGYGNAAITNVPLGTGNDFLKIFGPDCKTRFADITALSHGPQAAMDLIDCNGLLGIGVVCAGVDARIAADVHHYKSLPLVRGIGAYILSLVVNVVVKGITRPATVDMGGVHYEGETSIICICNGRYYGGGFMPVGDNMPDDGILEMLVVPKISRMTFFRLVGKYAKGLYRQYPELIWSCRGSGMTFRSPEELVAVVDGETMTGREFTVRLSEKKVNFFYPAGVSYQPQEAVDSTAEN